MTRLIPTIGSKKTFTVSYATPRESLESSPITLPTSEPADPQITWTVLDSDLPVITPKPFSVKYVACVYGAGKFVTTGTLYWRMTKNGTSVANGSASIAANTFYTVNAFFLDVLPGDVLGLKLWSSVSDSNWDYKAIFCYPTRFFPFPLLNYKQILAKVKVWNSDSPTLFPTLTLGNPTPWNPLYPWQLWTESGTQATVLIGGTTTVTFNIFSPHATYGVYRVGYYGDVGNANTASVQTDATYRPKYYRNYLNIKVECRPLRIE
jgi:hypothetical protein